MHQNKNPKNLFEKFLKTVETVEKSFKWIQISVSFICHFQEFLPIAKRRGIEFSAENSGKS